MNGVAPTWSRSQAGSDTFLRFLKLRPAALAARTMTGRNGESSVFAGVAVFLASAASDYITGQATCADGDFSAT